MMEHDPRVSFRHKGEQPPRNTFNHSRAPEVQDDELEPIRRLDASGKEMYDAFRISPRREEHLEMRFVAEVWHFPRFLDMVEIIPNQRKGTEIALLFPTYAVFIWGRNLLRVVYALKAHRCAFIEQYRKDIFAPVEDEKAPFISLMELKTRKEADEYFAKLRVT